MTADVLSGKTKTKAGAATTQLSVAVATLHRRRSHTHPDPVAAMARFDRYRGDGARSEGIDRVRGPQYGGERLMGHLG
jgi:hypothetical protein